MRISWEIILKHVMARNMKYWWKYLVMGPRHECKCMSASLVFAPNMHKLCMSPRWLLRRLLFWGHMFEPRHCNSFEDRAPANAIYGYPMFNGRSWLHACILSWITGYQGKSPKRPFIKCPVAIDLPVFIGIASLALRKTYDFLGGSEVTLKEMGQIHRS